MCSMLVVDGLSNAQSSTRNKNKKKDFLHTFPVNTMAYSNNVGAIVGYVSPKLGNLFWAPTFMYYGADIYEKYKKSQDSDDENKKSDLKQTVSLAALNLTFPLLATLVGNQFASLLSMLGKDSLPLETKEDLLKHHATYARHCDSVNIFAEFPDEYKFVYNNILNKHIEDNLVKKSYNPLFLLKKIFINNNKNFYEKSRVNMIKYINSNIDEMFNDYKSLRDNKKPEHFSDELFNRFKQLKKHYAKAFKNNEENPMYAINDILQEVQHRKLYSIKMTKMLGGLVVLLMARKPYDILVNFIIKKLFNNFNEEK